MARSIIGKGRAKFPPAQREKLKEDMLAYLKNCGHGLEKRDFYKQFPKLNDIGGLWERIIREFVQTGKVYKKEGKQGRWDAVYFYRDMSHSVSYLPYDSVQNLLKKAKAEMPDYNWFPLEKMFQLLGEELLQPRFKTHLSDSIAVDFAACEVGDVVVGAAGVERLGKCEECGDPGVIRTLGTGVMIVTHYAVWKKGGWETVKYCPVGSPSFQPWPITQDIEEPK